MSGVCAPFATIAVLNTAIDIFLHVGYVTPGSTSRFGFSSFKTLSERLSRVEIGNEVIDFRLFHFLFLSVRLYLRGRVDKMWAEVPA